MERRRPLFASPAPRAWYSLALALLLPLAVAAGEPLSITASALSDGRALLVIDGSPRMLRAGQTSPEGVTLISASAREAVVEVGGVRRTLAPGRAASGGFATPARKRVAIQRGGQQEYLVTGTVNGLQLQFLVDTGANVVAMNAAEARRLGIDYRLNGTPAAVQTAGGVVKAWSVMLDRVEVAGIAVRHVDATVLEGEYPVRALLGMSWLGRVSMREEHGVLYLEER
jgi:aspartyl protease family protein